MDDVSEAARVGGDASLLVLEDVTVGLEQHFIAGRGLRRHRELVAHRAARHVDTGVLTRQMRNALLELLDRRIVTEHIVAHRRAGHRLPHRSRRTRHRVTAKIDRHHCLPRA